jgi:hypothetical protein
LLSSANVEAPKDKKYWFRETLRLGTGPDEIQIAGHSFPANAHIPKAAYALSYSYSWTDAPVSKVELDLGDYRRRLIVSGTAVDQVEAISAALEHDLSQYSAIGGTNMRLFAGGSIGVILLGSLMFSGAYCILERRWRFLGMPIFSLVGLMLLLALPFQDLFAGFAVYQGDPSWIVRYAPQLAFAGLIITIAGVPLSFLFLRGEMPDEKRAGQKRNERICGSPIIFDCSLPTSLQTRA